MADWEIICADVVEWAERYDGPPFHASRGLHVARGVLWASRGLNFGFYLSMALKTECDKVVQLVGLFVVAIEKTKRLLMVNRKRLSKFIHAGCSGFAAVPAGIIITTQRFSALSVPIGAMPIRAVPINKKGVILTLPVIISALPGAIFATTFALKAAREKGEVFATVDTDKFTHGAFGAFSHRSILACRGAMFTPPVLKPGRDTREGLPAIFTYQFNLSGGRNILGSPPLIGVALALIGAVFSGLCPVRLNREISSTDYAGFCYHNHQYITNYGMGQTWRTV